nr:response regulator [Pleurocapsa sp. CCALA 161]
MNSEQIMSESAILCVDDEVVILDSLKEQLKRKFGDRFIYEVAESADEAWEVIEELQQDEIQVIAIVSDWLMPGIKGDEFLIQIHQRFPQLITVMLTGQADEEAIERAKKQANLHACLHKPWTEQELTQIITSALD